MALNKTSIVNMMSKNSKLDKTDCARALRAFHKTIENAVSKHETVRLVGFFTMKVVHRNPRTFRNPQTGKLDKTHAKNVPVLKAGQGLCRLANQN